jgi:hypothetical protein
VLLRDGFSYVFKLGSRQQGHAGQGGVWASAWRRAHRDHRAGSMPRTRVSSPAGAGFLADGDTVRVVDAAPDAASATAAPAPAVKTSAKKLNGRRAMNVSSWSIRNPIPAVMLFVMLTLAGLLGFSAMKIQQFPDIDLPTINVTANLPGTAPAQMETEVARKIENAVAALQGVKNIYTKVQDGVALVTVEFRLEKPTQEALDDVRSAVSRVRCRPAWPTCGPGHRQARPGGRAHPDLHRGVQRAWTTRR